MRNLHTHFEQAPLASVPAIVQAQRQANQQSAEPELPNRGSATAKVRKQGIMDSPFDIFRVEGAGSLLWRGAATSLTDAKSRVSELAQSSPADYLIVNMHTGVRVRISADGTENSQERPVVESDP